MRPTRSRAAPALINDDVDFDRAHTQAPYRVRFEWGQSGAAALTAPGVDAAVVVDVLSFTTSVSIAATRGVTVYPYRWRDAGAAAYAMRKGAKLAVGRFEARSATSGAHVSLSPAAMERIEGVERLVLPSPNGSTICFELADSGAAVYAASLRNAGAVARALQPLLADGGTVAVVAAGERWPDESLRPAWEDLWGAGAVIAALAGADVEGISPEAQAASNAYHQIATATEQALMTVASGVELVEKGYRTDVEAAARVDVDDVAPRLIEAAFRA
ncbi:2-phosphosulfolactate phosphatase [Nocardioides sp. Bht2]|uniref:2-phosphosulfolactate phosphatase n=1 Tax=Nocardioides sp. Bht2 TaxID=3392297 RepID=UPI0039B6E82F